jgi:hypothetical protein
MFEMIDLCHQKPSNVLQKPNKSGILTLQGIMTEQEIVKECLIEIFRKNGYTELDRLTQRNFDHVSQEIENATGILISGTTIKRLLNGEFTRLPQVATLDATSKYLGHKNWQEYKSGRQLLEVPANTKNEPRLETKKQKLSVAGKSKLRAVVFICLIVGAIGAAALLQINKTSSPNFDKASFSVRKITENEIPNTVVFDYDVDEIVADSFFIQQSWDKNRRVRISRQNHTLTDIYYEPGYHIAKLIANDLVIRTVEVSIPTDRWVLFAKDNPGSKPEYIATDDTVEDGVFRITEKSILDNQVDPDKEKEYAYTFFPSKIDVSSDNFILKTKVRIKEIKNNACPYITLDIFNQGYTMFFKNTLPGCSSEASLQFGDKLISGKETDLASLGSNVREWTDLELTVNDKHVTILVNGQNVYSSSYEYSSRFITGLGFMSNGICEIDFVELKGLDGTVVAEDNFNQ